MPARFDAGAILLAGGASRRMGRDKRLLPFCGVPLICHVARQLEPLFAEVLVSTNSPEQIAFLNLPMVQDRNPGEGPLMGMASALGVARFPWNLVAATDIPQIPVALVERLYAHTHVTRCVVPREPGGQVHPLFGFYHRDLAEDMFQFLSRGERRVVEFLDEIEATYVPVESALLENLNTPADYQAANQPPHF